MCRLLKQKGKSAPVPVILIGGCKVSGETVARGLDAGAPDFIRKPIGNVRLAAKLRVMLRIKKYEDELRRLNIQLKKQVRKRWRDSEEKCKNVSYGTREVDTEGKYLFLSPKMEEILGYPSEKLIGKSVFNFTAPGERKRLKKTCRNSSRKRTFQRVWQM